MAQGLKDLIVSDSNLSESCFSNLDVSSISSGIPPANRSRAWVCVPSRFPKPRPTFSQEVQFLKR